MANTFQEAALPGCQKKGAEDEDKIPLKSPFSHGEGKTNVSAS